MNPVSQLALDRAREKSTPALIDPMQFAMQLTEIVITNLINRLTALGMSI